MVKYLPLLLPLVIITAAIIIVSSFISSRSKKKLKGRSVHDRKSILKEANKRLAGNPKDAEALTALAELHYTEENYSQAMKTYGILLELCASNSSLDEKKINLRFGLSAMKAGIWPEAYQSLDHSPVKGSAEF